MDLQSAAPPARIFAGKSHVGLFETTMVERSPTPRKTAVVSAVAVGYRITFQLKSVLPPGTVPLAVVVTGQKGEGEGAGSLGLQDWLPSAAAETVTLAFDPDRIARARDYEFLAGGVAALTAWGDCRRYYECFRDGALDPLLAAGAIAHTPAPWATFFRLIFGYDRKSYNHPAVIQALGSYFADASIPPPQRLAVVAHYLGGLQGADEKALPALAAGLFQLIFDLAASDQAAGTGVVFQRMFGYFRTPAGTWRIPPPPAAQQRLDPIRQLLEWPPAGVTPQVREGIAKWLAKQ